MSAKCCVRSRLAGSRWRRLGAQTLDEVYACHFQVDVDGWQIVLFNDCDTLDYCENATSPDGRLWRFELGDRLGTDPVALLSTWEHQTLERLLKAL